MIGNNFYLDQVKSQVAAASAGKDGRFVLTNAAVIQVLEAYLEKRISASDLMDWAEFFDVNEEVELQNSSSLPDVLFELSSPEINGEINPDRAIELIARLKK